jgi:transposase
MQVTTIGLDIAKNVFQVHGIDAKGKVVVRKQLRRGQMIAYFKALPPCLIGMEALCHGALLGARADEARPQGASDAGEGCESLR